MLLGIYEIFDQLIVGAFDYQLLTKTRKMLKTLIFGRGSLNLKGKFCGNR